MTILKWLKANLSGGSNVKTPRAYNQSQEGETSHNAKRTNTPRTQKHPKSKRTYAHAKNMQTFQEKLKLPRG